MDVMNYVPKLKGFVTKYRIPLSLIPLFLLLTSPIIIFQLDREFQLNVLAGVLFVTSVFLIPFYFFRNHLKLFLLLPAPFIFILPAILFTMLKFKIAFDDSIMMLVYNTNGEEASELLKPYLLKIIIGYICLILTVILFYKLLPKRIHPKKALLTSIVALLLFFTIPIVNFGITPYYKNLKTTCHIYYPFYLIYYGNHFYKDLQNIDNYARITKNFSFHACKKDRLSQRQVYILVIGETGRYDHWGINGYGRNTSPLLDTIKSLISFRNVITAGSFTEVSVPLIITLATPLDFNPAWREKGIVTVFKEAGFETYWITNQFYGNDKGMITVHARESDHLILLRKSISSYGKPIWDMELADSLQKMINTGPCNMFIVIHEMGGHFEYTKRYPPQFNKFRPSGEGKNLSPSDTSNKTMLINGYDNTILYTDAVLDSFISALNQKNIVGSLLYITDHGENLMDDSRHLFLHQPGLVTKYVAHVPLFIFTTEDYDKIYAQKVAYLKDHITVKYLLWTCFPPYAEWQILLFPDGTAPVAFQVHILKKVQDIFLGE